MENFIVLHTHTIMALLLALLSGSVFVYLIRLKESFIGKKWFQVWFFCQILWQTSDMIRYSLHPSLFGGVVYKITVLGLTIPALCLLFIAYIQSLFLFLDDTFPRGRKIVLYVMIFFAVIACSFNFWNEFYNHSTLKVLHGIGFIYGLCSNLTILIACLLKSSILKKTKPDASRGVFYLGLVNIMFVGSALAALIFGFYNPIGYWSFFIIIWAANLIQIVLFINYGAAPTSFQVKMSGFTFVIVMSVLMVITLVFFPPLSPDETVISLTQQDGFIKLIVIILLSMTVIQFFLPYLLKKTLTQPLLQLLEGVQKVNTGDLTTNVKVANKDEIGDLTQNFNLMTGTIRKTQNELKLYAENLEQQVSERTAEIVNKNQQIELQRDNLQKNFEELKIAQSQLKELDNTKSRFFANVSHELRTPLTLMLAPIGTMIKSNELNHRNLALANLVRRHSQQLLGLVNEILDLTKLESGKMITHEEPTNIYDFLRRLIAAFESYAGQRAIKLVFEFDENFPHALMLDKPKFEKIFNNLAANAIKFTPPGGTVTVKISQTSATWLLSVIDTGRGIHPIDLPNIFNRFYQTNQADNPVEGGTGIGLALANELALVMRGKIFAESTLGQGAKFILELPKHEVIGAFGLADDWLIDDGLTDDGITDDGPTDTGLFETDISRSVVSNSKSTILVVEDNASLRTYLNLILSDKYDVVTAENGEEALKILDLRFAIYDLPLNYSNNNLSIVNRQSSIVNRIDLIISDIMMPVMDGFQFIEKIKEDIRFNTIPIVMLTARAEMQDKLKALRIGVDDYLTKPFEEEELFARIKNLLNHAQVRRQIRSEIREKNLKEKKQSTVNNHQLPINNFSIEDLEWSHSLRITTEKHIGDFNLSVDSLADLMHISRAQFFKRVQLLTGLTPLQYIQEIRFNHARHLLEQRSMSSVKAIAASVGIQKTQYFSEHFKERFGKSPSEYLV